MDGRFLYPGDELPPNWLSTEAIDSWRTEGWAKTSIGRSNRKARDREPQQLWPACIPPDEARFATKFTRAVKTLAAARSDWCKQADERAERERSRYPGVAV